MRNLKIKSSTKSYEVKFYTEIADLVDSFSENKKIYIIDKKVYKIYSKYFADKHKIIIPASENSKTLKYASKVFDYLIKNDCKTDIHLVIVGGGILQDLGGFIASIFGRGVKYTLVPTTLLSMCDSCIGGKTSINHNSRKNILGSFYPPDEIKISLQFLETISAKDLFSGYGELIKFYCLDKKIKNLNFQNLEECIFYGLRKKAKIIEKDEFDKAERKLLNFGHTFGHALESSSNYNIPHGSAVILGILIANEISFNLNFCSESYNKEVQRKIIPFIKEIKIKKEWFDFKKLLRFIKADKKNTEGTINMVLNKNQSFVLTPIRDMLVLEKSLNNIYEIIRLRN